jgi:hypothetical protein
MSNSVTQLTTNLVDSLVEAGSVPPLQANQLATDVLQKVGAVTDTTPPTTTATVTGPSGNNGWYRGPVQVTLNATDPDSSVAATNYNLDGAASIYSAPFPVSGDGIHQLSFFSVDPARNQETPHTLTIKIDGTPPVVSGTPDRSPNGAGWYNSPVTVSFQCADALSGLAPGSPPAPTTLSSEGAGQSVTGTCTDLAGNSASATVSGINIDKTPPTITCSASPNVLWPPNNKLVPVSVSVTVTDALSGPAGFTLVSVTSNEPDSGQGDIQGFATGTSSTSGQLRAQRLGSGSGRVYTFTYSGSDRAGNTASCGTTVSVPHDQGQ